MTSKLTRERIEQYANDPRMCNINDEIRELARMALAAMDSEPVADVVPWSHPTEERTCDIRWRRHDVEPGPLYRHAQPAAVVTFYRDGIEAAAKWIDQQREAYDSEHGWSDPDTGAFEFGNDAQREYSSTLEELAEGIRALHPNAGMQPAPVVQDNSAITQHFDTVALETAREVMCDVNRRGDFLGGDTQLLSRIQCRIDNACRAAMLQAGNSPIIPDGYVMVPKEMTDAIGEAIAMQARCCGGIALDIYDAMIEAALQEVK
ncbi:hypothetical protein [Klebsiella pneumoniae]|uniref:hypothetical protein n=1 Tax=Klebsiella pneumoniae TaxID=573 RepID=UPI001FAD2B5A|nr:hypothetical protein [Klebsiella pneumoniae]